MGVNSTEQPGWHSAEPALDHHVRRVRTDRESFAEIYDHYDPKILRYCLRRLFCRSVAEDLMSDVFLAAATQVGRFRGKTAGEFAQWLYTIATNRIREYVRNDQNRRNLLQYAADRGHFKEEAVHDNVSGFDWPALYQAILTLKPRDQALITLKYCQDLTNEEVASVLNLQPGAVRVAITRALNRLRERFGVHGSSARNAQI